MAFICLLGHLSSYNHMTVETNGVQGVFATQHKITICQDVIGRSITEKREATRMVDYGFSITCTYTI